MRHEEARGTAVRHEVDPVHRRRDEGRERQSVAPSTRRSSDHADGVPQPERVLVPSARRRASVDPEAVLDGARRRALSRAAGA